MKDIEIYNLASDVISSIASDLQQGIYSQLNGELRVAWSEINIFNAWAESKSDINQAPKHKIGFHYELVRQIFRDIESYYDYMESGIDQKVFDLWFQSQEKHLEVVTSLFSPEARQKNMFMGAITWVFFHELGHLLQEHGYIRNKYIGTNSSSIHECDIGSAKEIKGKAAAIYHVTEMAADFEAVNFCISELIRHFRGEELKAAIYLFVSAISCVLYRFHGAKSFIQEDYPDGSHPNPLIRLESIISQIYEFLSLSELHQYIGIKLSRKTTVEICTQGATTAGLFWLRSNIRQPSIPDNYFLMGNLNRPGGKNYLKVIVDTWDEIEPSIKAIRRFDDDLGLLQFSPETRKNLNLVEERAKIKN